ncbi:hypothetical protein EAO27_13500 [Sphingopyxis sp. YF1]|uniref:hypothetical protein n=1 Tax=Sphingopyxis sp. YF1 TaxID=2482763 RepID=UPI001F6151F5|nr:hypothetical protein [Sphingopyxis sp. YF1]UNU43624.1 hypothetical protein EAO27_13500 [Sphingopyxis sp. YF1]
MTALLRVVSARSPYRRGGIEFGSLPLVLGPEHFERGIAALKALAAIVADPVLKVKVADPDTPDVFRELTEVEVETIVAAADAAAAHSDPDAAEEAAQAIFAGIVGEIAPPVDPEQQAHAERLAAAMAAEKADAARLAAEKQAADAKAEEERAAAAKDEEQRLADQAAAATAKETAAATAAAEQASKGEPAPSAAKAEAVAKPASSSGRKPKADAANTKAAKG